MAILERGYRDLTYLPTRALARIWPIARHEFLTLFRMRFGAIVYLLCLGPTIGSLIFLLVRAGIWEVSSRGRAGGAVPLGDRLDPSAPWFFLHPVVGVLGFVPFLVLTTLVSVRAVAKDRAAGALEIYWTRAITPLGYFAGKWLGSLLLLGSAFVAAPFVLWVMSVLLAPDWSQFEMTIGFMPRLLFAFTLHTATMSLLAVGISALASTPNIASILWLFVMVGTTFGGQILRFMLREPWVVAINPLRASKRLVEWIVGVAPDFDYTPAIAGGVLAGLLAVVLGRALRRLRVLEAVAT